MTRYNEITAVDSAGLSHSIPGIAPPSDCDILDHNSPDDFL